MFGRKPPRDLNAELREWVRTCRDEPPQVILAALMHNAVVIARALDFSFARFIGGATAHYRLVAQDAAQAQAQPSDAASVGEVLRTVQQKGKR